MYALNTVLGQDEHKIYQILELLTPLPANTVILCPLSL